MNNNAKGTLRMLFTYETTRIIFKYKQPNSKLRKKNRIIIVSKHCQIDKLTVKFITSVYSWGCELCNTLIFSVKIVPPVVYVPQFENPRPSSII